MVRLGEGWLLFMYIHTYVFAVTVYKKNKIKPCTKKTPKKFSLIYFLTLSKKYIDIKNNSE